MLQPKEYSREVEKKWFGKSQGVENTNNLMLFYGNVSEVLEKTVLFDEMFQKLFIVKPLDSHKEYYPLIPNIVYKPQTMDRLLFINIDNNDYYGYYISIDTMQFSKNNYGHIVGVLTNLVDVYDYLKNEPTIRDRQTLFRGGFDNYVKFAKEFVQICNGVRNIELENVLGLDANSDNGSSVLLCKENIDEIIKSLQLIRDGYDYDVYQRTADGDDSLHDYSDDGKPTQNNLVSDSGIVMLANSFRLLSPLGSDKIQNAVLGQKLAEWMNNVAIYIQDTNNYLQRLESLVMSIKDKQEQDMNSIQQWVDVTYAAHIHPANGSTAAPSPGITSSPIVTDLSFHDKDGKKLFNTIIDKIYNCLSKVIGIN